MPKTDRLSPGAVALLKEKQIANFVTLMPSGAPQITPVWVDVEDDGSHVLINTADGRVKTNNIARDPRVAGGRLRGGEPAGCRDGGASLAASGPHGCRRACLSRDCPATSGRVAGRGARGQRGRHLHHRAPLGPASPGGRGLDPGAGCIGAVPGRGYRTCAVGSWAVGCHKAWCRARGPGVRSAARDGFHCPTSLKKRRSARPRCHASRTASRD